jgi:N-hydroxyarylamine O-acetyltransferase
VNINAYLERIHYHGSLEPTAETLRALQVAHLLTVPFENLSIHARQPIVLDDDALFTKIVANRRGGFCYEANGLFAALLRALGFEVAMLSAQVANAEGEFGPDFDHMTLMVTPPGSTDFSRRWLVDVGFGDSFLEPLMLDERGEQMQRSRAYQIISNGSYLLLMQRDDGDLIQRDEGHSNEKAGVQRESAQGEEGGISTPAGLPRRGPRLAPANDQLKALYRFTLQPHEYADYAEMCRYHQTSPDSHFTRSRICSRATLHGQIAGRITLSDRRLITTSKSGAHQPHQTRQERTLQSEAEYADVLREQFGIVMTS